MSETEKNLVDILLNPDARIDERDDAAMDLGSYDSNAAEEALVRAGSNPKEDYCVVASCGESLAYIWLRKDSYNYQAWTQLMPDAKKEVISHIAPKKPEWISESGALIENCG